MEKSVKIAFEQRVVMLPVSSILPTHKVLPAILKTSKYKRILRSISEVGIIEPLMVARMEEKRNTYMLLDGHVRLMALQELGKAETRCIVASDDEAFTYNKRVNRLATVQEHMMIMRALKRGVSEKKIAAALNVDTKLIRRRVTMLQGVVPEVVDLLKDKSVNPVTFEVIRKMKSMRQIEVAELMIAANNFTSSYAKALLAGTRQIDLAQADKPKKVGGLTSEQMVRMEREMQSVQQDFKAIEASYGDDMLNLVVASGYLGKLMANSEIEQYLHSHYPDFVPQFEAVIASSSLEQALEKPH